MCGRARRVRGAVGKKSFACGDQQTMDLLPKDRARKRFMCFHRPDVREGMSETEGRTGAFPSSGAHFHAISHLCGSGDRLEDQWKVDISHVMSGRNVPLPSCRVGAAAAATPYSPMNLISVMPQHLTMTKRVEMTIPQSPARAFVARGGTSWWNTVHDTQVQIPSPLFVYIRVPWMIEIHMVVLTDERPCPASGDPTSLHPLSPNAHIIGTGPLLHSQTDKSSHWVDGGLQNSACGHQYHGESGG